jgi:preprotein translocase subunit YajC
MEYLVLLTAGAQGAETPPPLPVGGGLLGMLLPLGLMVAMIYFLFIRPEGKRKKKAAEMLNALQIADEVVTSGGIVGRVIDVKPDSDTIVIETGGDKTRIRILKAYIIENRTIHE